MELDYKLRRVIIKYSVIISLFTFTLAKYFKNAIDDIADFFLIILLSIDLDNNGEPDVVQIKKYSFTLFNIKFAVGKLFYGLFRLLLQIIIVYLILITVLKTSKLIKL